ncbi:MAG TPA: hypothetical protein VF955_05200, partial [Pyrinomonadaceae bacterium]
WICVISLTISKFISGSFNQVHRWDSRKTPHSVLYAHVRRKNGFGGIIPLRFKPSSVNIKESMYAADFARRAPKLELFPKLQLFPNRGCLPTRYRRWY